MTMNPVVLPDGSAFATGSFPLPKDHWLYAPREYAPGADEPKELPPPILTHTQRDAVKAAVRYAIRGATDCGKESDFDPDAMVNNAVYALCGPCNAQAARALDKQEGGDHYKNMAIQPIEFIFKNGIGYAEGNVIKYVTRWRSKNGVEDLKKARHYLDLLIESESGNPAGKE